MAWCTPPLHPFPYTNEKNSKLIKRLPFFALTKLINIIKHSLKLNFLCEEYLTSVARFLHHIHASPYRCRIRTMANFFLNIVCDAWGELGGLQKSKNPKFKSVPKTKKNNDSFRFKKVPSSKQRGLESKPMYCFCFCGAGENRHSGWLHVILCPESSQFSFKDLNS